MAQGQELTGPLDNWTLGTLAELNIEWYVWVLIGLGVILLFTIQGANRIVDGPYLEDAVQIVVGDRGPDLKWTNGRVTIVSKTLTIRCMARQRDIESCQVQLEDLHVKRHTARGDDEWERWPAFNSSRLAWSFNDSPVNGNMLLPNGVPKHFDLVVYEHDATVEPHERKAKLVVLQEEQRPLNANEIMYARYKARCAISAKGDYEPARIDVYFEFTPSVEGGDEWSLSFVDPGIQVIEAEGWWNR